VSLDQDHQAGERNIAGRNLPVCGPDDVVAIRSYRGVGHRCGIVLALYVRLGLDEHVGLLMSKEVLCLIPREGPRLAFPNRSGLLSW